MSVRPPLPSLSVEEVPIDLLHPDPANPRRIGEDELDSLTRSLRRFGFVQPVLARREDRTVIAGHQRLVAARRLGLTTVPVTWLDSIDRAGSPAGARPEPHLGRPGTSSCWPGCWPIFRPTRASISPSRGSAKTRSATCSGAWRLARSANEPRASISTPLSKKRPASLGPSPVSCGRWASIDSCAETPPSPRTWSDCSAERGRRWPSPTRPTTSASATTAAIAEGPAGGGSPTTRSIRPPGRRSSGPGPRPFWPVWTERSTSACRARSWGSCRESSPRKVATGATRSSGTRSASSQVKPTTNAPMSRSGMAGAKGLRTTGAAIAIRTMSGRSPGRPMHPSIRR